MDFIERMFGISPDGGDGSTELMLLTVLVLIAAALTLAMVVQKIFRKGLITPSRGRCRVATVTRRDALERQEFSSPELSGDSGRCRADR